MASISDVFNALNDIKGKLDTLHSDSTNNGLKIDGTNSSLVDLRATVDARLSQLINGQNKNNQLTHHLTRQMETVVCALENISRNTCRLVNLADLNLQQTTVIREYARISAEIQRSAHPEAALELQRHDGLNKKIEGCCPPEPPKPPCRYETCKNPGPFPKHDPNG